MTRVAVLGANGQVGAEVCLLLGKAPGVELIPICRTPGGSAFLRRRGLDCRHGPCADPAAAPRLLEGAEVVLNFALAQGLPSEVRRTHTRMIENAFRGSPPGSVHVYFSTTAVYGTRRILGLSFRDAYAREKLYCERLARRESRRSGKPLYVFRLGHVCGELQDVTAQIRGHLARGPLALPRGGRLASNTTYTATIVEAVLRTLSQPPRPGTYDLSTRPEWSWREVYEYEAEQAGLRCEIASVPEGSSGLLSLAVRAARRAAGSPGVREWGRRLLARFPDEVNLRWQARWYRSRARREIAALGGPPGLLVPLPEPSVPQRPLPGLTDPAELRRRPLFRLPGEEAP